MAFFDWNNDGKIDMQDALWNWKWSFENHWSYHAVDTMRALNQLMND